MKIHGVDPIVLERIKERTQKETIIQPEKTKVTADKHPEDRERKHEQKHNKKNLEEVVTKLNRMMEEESLPLRFQVVIRDDKLKVQLLNIEENKVVSEVFPEKVYKLFGSPERYVGFFVDKSV